MEAGRTLREVMRREGWSQREVAQRANVSQPTVSRMLSGREHRGPAYRQLSIFIHKRADSLQMPREALDALQQIWDGSDEHAAALAALISASGGLWPGLSNRRRHDDR